MGPSKPIVLGGTLLVTADGGQFGARFGVSHI